MFRLSSLVLVVASAFCFGCHKDKSAPRYTPTGDYIIAGQTGGFVTPTTKSPYFIVADSAVWEDTFRNSTNIPTDYSGFTFTYLLPQARYDSVDDLLATIPSELLAESGASIGAYIPDVGYTDVRAHIAGANYSWKFQADQSGSSSAVQVFLVKIGKMMQ